MNRPPRRRDESLFAGGGWGCTCFYGLLIAGISMLAFLQEPVGTIKSAGMTLTIPHLQAVLKDAQVLARSQTYAFTRARHGAVIPCDRHAGMWRPRCFA